MIDIEAQRNQQNNQYGTNQATYQQQNNQDGMNQVIYQQQNNQYGMNQAIYQQQNNYDGTNQVIYHSDNHQENNEGLDQQPNKDKPLFDKARIGFIRKVYLILSAQLLVTVLITVASMYSKGFSDFQQKHYWLMIIAIVFIFVIQFAILCFKKVSRTVPINYICLFIFTIAMAYLVSAVCSQIKNKDIDGAKTVLIAATMTLGIVVALTIYAFYTQTDFTMMGGFLFVFGVVMIIFGLFLSFKYSKTAYIIYSVLGCLLYSLYLIYDTQLIAGKGKYQLSIDDYVVGALCLYMDIIGLFLEILGLLRAN